MAQGVRSARCRRAMARASSRLPVRSLTQPWSYRVWIRESSTSAMMDTAPAISAALPWAPLMPPSPADTNSRPARFPSAGMPSFSRPALSRVLKVPWTMPWGPMYIQPPAVIWP